MPDNTNVNNNASVVVVGRTAPVPPGQQKSEKSVPVVIDLMALNANRTNSISGAVTEETKNFRKMTNFSSEELDVIKQIFPNLSENYFAQFQTLEAEVAQLILSDLEKFQKQIAAERQRKKDERAAEQLRRSKLSKRELRGR